MVKFENLFLQFRGIVGPTGKMAVLPTKASCGNLDSCPLCQKPSPLAHYLFGSSSPLFVHPAPLSHTHHILRISSLCDLFIVSSICDTLLRRPPHLPHNGILEDCSRGCRPRRHGAHSRCAGWGPRAEPSLAGQLGRSLVRLGSLRRRCLHSLRICAQDLNARLSPPLPRCFCRLNRSAVSVELFVSAWYLQLWLLISLLHSFQYIRARYEAYIDFQRSYLTPPSPTFVACDCRFIST